MAAVVVAAGGEVDETQIALLFTNLEGKNIHELLAKGEIDLKNCTSGGGGAAPAAAPAGDFISDERTILKSSSNCCFHAIPRSTVYVIASVS